MLSNNHWRQEDYKQIMKASEWKKILLSSGYNIMVHGEQRELTAKKLFDGVVEVSKKPLTSHTANE